MNNGRIALVVFSIFVVLVVIFVYNLSVENREVFGKMINSATQRLQASQASQASVQAGQGGPPLSAYVNFKDNSKLAEFRQEVLNGPFPDEETMKTMSARQLLRIYLSYMDNIDVVCQRYLRMGNIGDGGWEICDDVRWRPMGDCIIYSFGINNDFSFDDHAAKTYDCHVYAFDPSMNMNSTDRSPKVHFYRWGIGDADTVTGNKWQLYTVATLRKKLGHDKRPIDVFKMDVEGSEWGALPNMAATGQLQDIRQLFVEFHGVPRDQGGLIARMKNFWALEQAGFRKFQAHKNPACKHALPEWPGSLTNCYEVYFVNTRLPNQP